jgi:hypothetical protein
MGKDYERGDIDVGRENACKNGPRMRSRTVLFGVDSGAKINAETGPESARGNAQEGGRKPRGFEHRKGAEIDADSDAESRIESRTKTRAISTPKKRRARRRKMLRRTPKRLRGHFRLFVGARIKSAHDGNVLHSK